MLSLYSGCINTANQQAQDEATMNAFNNLVLSLQTSTTTGVPQPIDMDAVECTYEQLLHAMQVRFQQLCVSQPGKFKKDGIGSNKGNSNEVALSNVNFKGTCFHCQKKATMQAIVQIRQMVMATISRPAA